MSQFGVDKIKNIAVVGHAGSGKTSLAEAVLFKSGAIDRLGKVAKRYKSAAHNCKNGQRCKNTVALQQADCSENQAAAQRNRKQEPCKTVRGILLIRTADKVFQKTSFFSDSHKWKIINQAAGHFN